MKHLLLLLLIFPLFVFSQPKVPDPQPNSYVSDYANILTPEQINQLNKQIYSFDSLSSVQIAILVIDKLPEDVQIDDYAREVGRKWGVGHVKNGIVCVFAIGDHKDRIETAENVEGSLPDATAFEILEALKPQLKAKDYFGAFQGMLNQIQTNISPEAKQQRALADEKVKRENEAMFHTALNVVLGLLGIGLLAVLGYLGYRKKQKAKELQAKKDEMLKEISKENIELGKKGLETSIKVYEEGIKGLSKDLDAYNIKGINDLLNILKGCVAEYDAFLINRSTDGKDSDWGMDTVENAFNKYGTLVNRVDNVVISLKSKVEFWTEKIKFIQNKTAVFASFDTLFTLMNNDLGKITNTAKVSELQAKIDAAKPAVEKYKNNYDITTVAPSIAYNVYLQTYSIISTLKALVHSVLKTQIAKIEEAKREEERRQEALITPVYISTGGSSSSSSSSRSDDSSSSFGGFGGGGGFSGGGASSDW